MRKKNSVLDEYRKNDGRGGQLTQENRNPSGHSRLQLKQAFTNTNAYKRPLDSNCFSNYSTQDLRYISSDELITVWKHYDRKDMGYLHLKSHEWRVLAEHIVERIEVAFLEDYIDKLRHERPSASAAEVKRLSEAALEKERPYLLPGVGKTHEKNVEDMTVFLFRNMDVNKDGMVTQQEFTSTWASFMPKFFTPRNSGGSKACTIL